MKLQPPSPLALPFEKALEPSNLLIQMKTSYEHQLRNDLIQHGNAALGVALATAKFVLDSGTISVVFEGGIPAGAKLMTSAGKTLPVLVDGKTGQTLKMGRVASKGRTAASVTANAALIVVEAAHMISGHDNAKRLKKIERSVDQLVQAHESELKSRLEAIYRYSKELLHGGSAALNDHDRRDLHQQCRDLMEIRARWRDGFRFRLSQIDRAEAGWLNKLFWWTRDGALEKSRQQKATEAANALELVQMMHFSLMLQMVLAEAAGKLEPFRKLTLEDECHSWKSLVEFGRVRISEIAGASKTDEFRDFLAALEDLVDFWSPSQWAAKSPQSNAENAPEQRGPRTTLTVCSNCGSQNRIPDVQPKGRRAICGHCKTALEVDTIPKSTNLLPPENGWTVDEYAEATGMSGQEAWHELRRLSSEGVLVARRKKNVIHYVEAEGLSERGGF